MTLKKGFTMTEQPQSDQNQNINWPERRQYQRIEKNFILTYFEKENPSVRIELTQLKNISKGGLCFITTKAFLPSTRLGLELRTPYLSETTYLEGVVLESRPKIEGIIYETRLQFEELNPQGDFLISKMMEVFMNGGSSTYE